MHLVVYITYNMGNWDLPDIYPSPSGLRPSGSEIYIRQIPLAHVITYTYSPSALYLKELIFKGITPVASKQKKQKYNIGNFGLLAWNKTRYTVLCLMCSRVGSHYVIESAKTNHAILITHVEIHEDLLKFTESFLQQKISKKGVIFIDKADFCRLGSSNNQIIITMSCDWGQDVVWHHPLPFYPTASVCHGTNQPIAVTLVQHFHLITLLQRQVAVPA